jgi:hypothetical protein
MNPVPFTVRVKPAVPAVAFPGESEPIAGAGLAEFAVKPGVSAESLPGVGLDGETLPVLVEGALSDCAADGSIVKIELPEGLLLGVGANTIT